MFCHYVEFCRVFLANISMWLFMFSDHIIKEVSFFADACLLLDSNERQVKIQPAHVQLHKHSVLGKWLQLLFRLRQDILLCK